MVFWEFVFSACDEIEYTGCMFTLLGSLDCAVALRLSNAIATDAPMEVFEEASSALEVVEYQKSTNFLARDAC